MYIQSAKRNLSNLRCEHAFRKESCVAVRKVAAQEPAIAKFIVAFDKLNFVTFCKGKFVGTSSLERVCSEKM